MTLTAIVLSVALLTQPRADRGRVVYVTNKHAYLDHGAGAGLKAGEVLEILRGQAGKAGTCTVEDLTDDRAMCAGENLRAGDTFMLPGGPEPVAAGPAVVSLPPLAHEAQIEKAQALLSTAPYGKVDEGVMRPELARTSGLIVGRAGAEAWAMVSGGGPGFEREHVFVSLKGVPLGFAGLSASAELEARHWSARASSATTAALPDRTTELFVWEAEVNSRQPGQALTLGFGRVWPWHVPGVSVVDGAQVGYQNGTGTVEAGVFGGGVPDPFTMTPRFNRWIGGAYLSHTASEAHALLRVDHEELRVSARDDGSGKVLGEAEVATQLWLGETTDVGAQVLGSTAPGLDRLAAHVRLRPTETLQVLATGRYIGRLRYEPDLGPRYAAGERLAIGDADLVWLPFGWLSLTLNGGASRVFSPQQNRQYAGPEVGFPTLFGGAGGLALGYREEFGAFSGRNVYLQATVRPGQSVQFLARLSYYEDRPGSSTFRELGLYLNADARLLSWLWLRTSVLTRAQPLSGDVPAGVVGSLDLEGRF
jgi:hypothetical protein